MDKTTTTNNNRTNLTKISTKKTFSRNKRDTNKPAAKALPPATTTATIVELTGQIGELDLSTSLIKPGTSNHKVQEAIPKSSDFSSRNSLRTAQSIAVNTTKSFPLTMPNINMYQNREPLNIMDDTRFYERLNPDATYRIIDNKNYCMLCCKVKEACQIENNHYYNYNQLRAKLLEQPPTTDSLHMHALEQLLINWYTDNSLTDEMIEERYHIVEEFNTILSKKCPNCHTRLIGSLFYGASLRTSDINLELKHPNSNLFEYDSRSKDSDHHKLINPLAKPGSQINRHYVHYDLISNAIDSLFTVMNQISVSYKGTPEDSFKIISDLNDLNAKVPYLVLEHRSTGIKLNICCYAETKHKLAVLLRTYLSFDDRASILSILVKYWAHCCNIDKPDSGTLSPDSYVILVIYFLQRTTPPILPCLHEVVFSENKNRGEKSPSDNRETTVEHNGLHEGSSDIDSQVSATAQKSSFESSVENGTNELLDDLMDAADEEEEDEEEDDIYIDWENQKVKNMNWITTNDESIHKLFIDFLKFLLNEFNNSQTPYITIRSLKKPSIKRWSTQQVKVIENPIKPAMNMSRSIGTYRTFQYIKQCFEHSYYYLTSIPVDINLKPEKLPKKDPKDYIQLYINYDRFDYYLSMLEDNILKGKIHDLASGIIQQKLFARDVEVTEKLIDRCCESSSFEKSLAIIPKILSRQYYEYHMKPKDTGVTLYCWFCRSNGHTRRGCGKFKVESLLEELNTYDPTLDHEANLDPFFINNYLNSMITSDDIKIYKRIVNELTKVINSSTGLKCRLDLFGSTVNNLGSYNSDLDICMTLEDNPTGQGVNCVEILKKVHKILLKKNNIHSVEAILTARVPIIKFKVMRNKRKSDEDIDVDLSMYNQCATYNSKLLRMYTLIDERLPQLFFVVKRYAKACQIADASKGTLSSYAWSLLVIHYLQQVRPSVLPVLQEPLEGNVKPIFGINGWNVWFNDNIASISSQFRTENRQTITQLFKGFFLYYGNFNFEYHVVSIRTSKLITRFQKNWNNCMMAIEDPFELTYNLSSRLDEPMAIYIMKSFGQTYRHIDKIQRSLLQESQYWDRETLAFNVLSRIFNGRAITGLDKPPFRGCRICNRIGHRFKDCPEMAKNNQFRKRSMR